MHISSETRLFIREHSTDDVRTLALQSKKYPDVDMPVAITQIAGRQIAAEKIPSWKKIEDIRYPKHLSLEQCSSEITAYYKAGLLQGDSLTDLTGGFGVDCSFLAERFKSVTYVERQEELCGIAAHNFLILGLNHINVKNEDGIAHLKAMSPVDCIFLDPARRNEHGGKAIAISDCEPDVAELEGLLLNKAKQVMVKLSPMLDLSLALRELQQTQEVHIISVNNECKELLLILGQTVPQCSQCNYTDSLDEYLYEPNTSLLKAGAFKSLSSAFPIRKLHPNSHLYTSDTLIDNFPGRIFRIVNQCSFNKKESKECLADLKKANITIRNFPATVVELRKRIKLSEGGDTYLFASTLNNEQKVLIRCEKIK